MSDFHLLRPEWLVALIPLLALMLYRKRKQALSGQWKNIIAPQLQPYVLKQQKDIQPKESWIQGALWFCALLAIIALSGPSWQKQPSLVYSNQAGLVIALDLSLSMTSQDLPPSRLQRAKYKITDILNQHQNKNLALIAYAGDAHIASPLTKDKKTIQSMLPALDPYIMPAQGSNLVHLVEQASALFEQGKSQPRRLLLVTDGVEPQDIQAATQALNAANIQLSILAIGTEQGAPIVKPNGQFFKDGKGNVIMPKLEWDNLQTLADASNARITKISNNDQDIHYLLADNSIDANFSEQKDTVEFDQWQDNGYWLVIPILILSLLAFRKGVLILLVIGIFQIPTNSWAESNLPNLLLNKNQIAQKQFINAPEKAAELFEDDQWKASSLYKSGDYQGALDIWQNHQDAQSLYNKANALAHLQKFDEAIESYEQSLAIEPDSKDALANKALVEQMKKQQEQQSKQDQQQDGEKGDQQQNQDGQQGEQQNQDGKKGDSSEQQSSQNQSGQQGDTSEENKEQQSEEANESGEEKGDESQNPLAKQQTQQEKEKQQQAQQARAQQSQEDQPPTGEESMSSAQGQMKSTEQLEQDQAMQQWMERIPDDPGGLLRNKFIHQYNKRNRNEQNGDRKPW